MTNEEKIWSVLESTNFNLSTDTRKDVAGSVYFALKGEVFDGNKFINDALEKGAVGCVTDSEEISGEKIYFVPSVLETLNSIARKYRNLFEVPVIVIGGSNGKTTSKDLLREVLQTKYKVHATVGSLNNHFGVPLSILSMPRDAEIGLFEVGANHPGEHLELLSIISPTHVVVTNNGMDHLEGFKTPDGVRAANKEIYDWAKNNKAVAFVNKNHTDLIEDSKHINREVYGNKLKSKNNEFLTVEFNNEEYKTNLVGNYNLENVELAVSIGEYFKIPIKTSLESVSRYIPVSKRSQRIVKNGVNFVVDCYNANPTSMNLSIESFLETTKRPRGIIVGDMLELGEYSKEEHLKVVDMIDREKIDCVIYIGENFKQALGSRVGSYNWFPDSDKARDWFFKQNFIGLTFLLKGSRGVKVENILN